jgi:hypothetical protein
MTEPLPKKVSVGTAIKRNSFVIFKFVVSIPVGLQLESSVMDTSEPVQARRRRTASASASVAAEATALSVDIGLLLNSALISAYVGSFPDIRATVVRTR